MGQVSLEPRAITVAQFQKVANLGRNTAYGLLNAPGGVRALKVGTRWVIPITEIDHWLAQAGQAQ